MIADQPKRRVGGTRDRVTGRGGSVAVVPFQTEPTKWRGFYQSSQKTARRRGQKYDEGRKQRDTARERGCLLLAEKRHQAHQESNTKKRARGHGGGGGR